LRKSSLPPNTPVGLPQKDRDLGLPEVKNGARRVSGYSPELGLIICERISEGDTLKEICEEEGFPTRQTVNRWVLAYPEFGRAYHAARELSSYSMEEEALFVGRQIRNMQGLTSQHVRAAEVLMNQLRWSAARRNARVFSEKSAVVVTVPVNISTTLDLNVGAGGGTVDHPDIYRLEAENIVEEAETIEIDTEFRQEQMADTSIAPLLGPGKAVVGPKTKAEARKEYFAKHGARGAARRKDITGEK